MRSKHSIVLAASITRARWHRDLMVNVSCGHRYDHVSHVTEQLMAYSHVSRENRFPYVWIRICILSFELFSMSRVNANRLNYKKKFNFLQKWLRTKIITNFIEIANRYSQMDNNNFFWRIHTRYLSKLFNYSFIIIYCWDNEFLKIKITNTVRRPWFIIFNVIKIFTIRVTI